MSEVILDLRVTPQGCTDHPIVRFNKLLRDVMKRNDKVKIVLYTKAIDFPPTIIKTIAEKKGLKVLKVEKINDEVKAVLLKEINNIRGVKP